MYKVNWILGTRTDDIQMVDGPCERQQRRNQKGRMHTNSKGVQTKEKKLSFTDLIEFC